MAYLSIVVIRLTTLFIRYLCGAYDGYLLWVERRGHWDTRFEPYFGLALMEIMDLDLVLWMVTDALLMHNLQIFLEKRFPTRVGTKDVSARYVWTNILIKWLIDNLLIIAVRGMLLEGTNWAAMPRYQRRTYSTIHAYTALASHFRTSQPFIYLATLFIPASLRVRVRDVTQASFRMFAIAVIRSTMPPLADGPEGILEMIDRSTVQSESVEL